MGAYYGAHPSPRTQAELVLSSRNIIVVSMSMMRKPRGVRYFPLAQVMIIDGRPQVFAAGTYSMNRLEVRFQHGEESFGFSSKPELHEWVENIYKLTTGRSDEIDISTDLTTDGMRSVGEPWKQTVDLVKATFGLAPDGERRGAATFNPDRVARKCTSCSAPLSGIAGRVIRCEYCQSDQQL